MSSSDKDGWNKQVLVTQQAGLEADCARLRLRIETKQQNGLDASKEQAELKECEARLAKLQDDLKKANK